MSTTIITAYFSIKSKFSETEYKSWILNFLKLDCNMVIFTDEKNYQFFFDRKTPNIYIIKTDIFNFKVYKYIDYWKYCWTIDNEINHSPELYMLWNEKPFLCEQAIQLNIFKSVYFFWMDIGCIRNDKMMEYIKKIQYPLYIPSDKFVLSKISEGLIIDKTVNQNGILQSILDLKYTGPSSTSKHSHNFTCIQGGFFGGHKNLWEKWTTLYEKEIGLFVENKVFGGKDQYIMTNIMIKNKDLFFVYNQEMYKLNDYKIDPWFLFLIRMSYPTKKI